MFVPRGVVALGAADLPGPAGDGVLGQGDRDHAPAAGPALGPGGTAGAAGGDGPGGQGPQPGAQALAPPGPAAPGQPAQAGIISRLQVEDAGETQQGEPETVQQAAGGRLDLGGGRPRAGEGPSGPPGQGQDRGAQDEGAGVLGAVDACGAPFFRCPQGASKASRPSRRRAG